jgi:hypothetical protein
MKELRNTKTLSQDSQFPGRDLKPGPPEYKSGMLTTRTRLSATSFLFRSMRYRILHFNLLDTHRWGFADHLNYIKRRQSEKKLSKLKIAIEIIFSECLYSCHTLKRI